MQRSLDACRQYGPRVLKIVGWGLVTLAISAFLVSLRILWSDDTDLFWDQPSMFPEIVRMAYSAESRSEWGPLWDVLFVVVPMWAYVAVFVPRLWDDGSDDPLPVRSLWDDLKEVVPPGPPILSRDYAEYEIVRPSPEAEPEPTACVSRTPTLRGFPAPRPPAEPARSVPSQEEIDRGWEDLAK